MTDRYEFKQWLKRWAKKFREDHYSADDIERLACACGFKYATIQQWKNKLRTVGAKSS